LSATRHCHLHNLANLIRYIISCFRYDLVMLRVDNWDINAIQFSAKPIKANLNPDYA
jgi:hypothetical protein